MPPCVTFFSPNVSLLPLSLQSSYMRRVDYDLEQLCGEGVLPGSGATRMPLTIHKTSRILGNHGVTYSTVIRMVNDRPCETDTFHCEEYN